MTVTQSAAEHHADAAMHHGQAASFHRSASRHYQVGKDYAHAAHQALSAHGHALRASEHGQAARELYAAQEGSPLPRYLTRASVQPVSTALSAPAVLDGPAHHAAAAAHHEAARRHHAQAGTWCARSVPWRSGGVVLSGTRQSCFRRIGVSLPSAGWRYALPPCLSPEFNNARYFNSH
jgi:hypothetical protein